MLPIRHRRWQLRADAPLLSSADKLADSLNISPFLARVLCQRGYDSIAGASRFLEPKLSSLPDPDLLPDMDKACRRLQTALSAGEKIIVHGDYDVDGISGCALLVEVLRSLGGDVSYHIPLRLKDGYGLSADAVHQAAQDGCRLIVSVDCGISACAEALLARELGVDLIVTDHHQPGHELPVATALVNPHLDSNQFPYPDLAGVGVAFFMLIGLRKRLRQSHYFSSGGEPDLRHCLDLVALGTIADIAPLTGVNRTLVTAGLKLLEKRPRPGIAALKRVAGVTSVNSGVVGFRLAPRLNAAGRLEDAALGVQLLLGEQADALESLAQQLDRCNLERQALEKKVLDQAIGRIEEDTNQSSSIVLASSDWHSGVIGIVASRLVERYHRPTFLIALEDGIGKGSGRSIRGYDLYQALKECDDLLNGYGGHTMAAGLTINEANLTAFRQRFEAVVRARLTADMYLPTLEYDDECSLDLWSVNQVQELTVLGPFGAGNPQPQFVSRGCQVNYCTIVAEKHLKFSVVQKDVTLSAIAFGCADRLAECSGTLDILYRPLINQWRGSTQVQIQVIDFCQAGQRS
ncbi:MAG: single-stranded-DNA-specific exonuclease RecJ [Pelovirga sp.]